MTTIQTLQLELDRLQAMADECVTESGHIRGESRYKYQMLIRKAHAMRESISWLEGQGIGLAQNSTS